MNKFNLRWHWNMAFEESLKNIFFRNFQYGLSLFCKVSDGISNSFLDRDSIDILLGILRNNQNSYVLE